MDLAAASPGLTLDSAVLPGAGCPQPPALHQGGRGPSVTLHGVLTGLWEGPRLLDAASPSRHRARRSRPLAKWSQEAKCFRKHDGSPQTRPARAFPECPAVCALRNIAKQSFKGPGRRPPNVTSWAECFVNSRYRKVRKINVNGYAVSQSWSEESRESRGPRGSEALLERGLPTADCCPLALCVAVHPARVLTPKVVWGPEDWRKTRR